MLFRNDFERLSGTNFPGFERNGPRILMVGKTEIINLSKVAYLQGIYSMRLEIVVHGDIFVSRSRTASSVCKRILGDSLFHEYCKKLDIGAAPIHNRIYGIIVIEVGRSWKIPPR